MTIYALARNKIQVLKSYTCNLFPDFTYSFLSHSHHSLFLSPPAPSLLPCRTETQTTELFEQLCQMFPEDEQKSAIINILHNHKEELDINRLTNFVLSALP